MAEIVNKKSDEDLITESTTRLQSMISSIPDIDVNKIFAPYLQKQQAQQPVTKAPGRLESFARAFGSQEGSDSVMQQLARHQGEQRDKNVGLMETEKEILKAKMQQEMSKGQADKALKTLREQKILESHLSENERARKMEDFEKQEGIKSQNRIALQEKKAQAAKTLLDKKIAEAGKGLTFEQRVFLKELTIKAGLESKLLGAQFAFSPNTLERSVSDADMPVMTQEVSEKIDALVAEAAKKGGGGAPPPSTVPPPAAAPNRLQAAMAAIKKEKGAKK